MIYEVSFFKAQTVVCQEKAASPPQKIVIIIERPTRAKFTYSKKNNVILSQLFMLSVGYNSNSFSSQAGKHGSASLPKTYQIYTAKGICQFPCKFIEVSLIFRENLFSLIQNSELYDRVRNKMVLQSSAEKRATKFEIFTVFSCAGLLLNLSLNVFLEMMKISKFSTTVF